MKLILAYIKPNKLQDVTLALHRMDDLPGLTVSDTRGFGRPRAGRDPETRREQVQDFVPGARLEIVCPDDRAEAIAAAIKRAAHTGLRGDGEIFILPVEQGMRIAV